MSLAAPRTLRQPFSMVVVASHFRAVLLTVELDEIMKKMKSLRNSLFINSRWLKFDPN